MLTGPKTRNNHIISAFNKSSSVTETKGRRRRQKKTMTDPTKCERKAIGLLSEPGCCCHVQVLARRRATFGAFEKRGLNRHVIKKSTIGIINHHVGVA
ncbi:hypothetical protein GWI33_020756 [Rhynchophorus ferrugineus]|uniref:Uncharacterized protein n=1 Tax=Rhynchophorus ferrugineus TaxID=354439 RepID=A0A834HRG3_RHYFE|nr:hypothetical protein GWI33_020756 [Rhynchophorus ferrugineus]